MISNFAKAKDTFAVAITGGNFAFVLAAVREINAPCALNRALDKVALIGPPILELEFSLSVGSTHHNVAFVHRPRAQNHLAESVRDGSFAWACPRRDYQMKKLIERVRLERIFFLYKIIFIF